MFLSIDMDMERKWRGQYLQCTYFHEQQMWEECMERGHKFYFLSLYCTHTHILLYTHHFHLSASFTLYFTDREITQIGRSVESCLRVGSNIKKWATPTAPDCLHTRTVHNSLQAEPSIGRQHPTDLVSALWRKHPLFLCLSIHRSVCLQMLCC